MDETTVPPTPTPTASVTPEPRSVSPLEDDPLAKPIKLTIREIKFKDPLENSGTASRSHQLGVDEPLNECGVTEQPPLGAEFQDSGDGGFRYSGPVELNLAGDTNVQAVTSSHEKKDEEVVVVDSSATAAENEQQQKEEACSRSSEAEAIILPSECTASTFAGGEQDERQKDDQIPDTTAEPKESDATATADGGSEERPDEPEALLPPPLEEGDRRSNDSLQQVKVVAAESAVLRSVEEDFQDHDDVTSTLDGLLLLHEVPEKDVPLLQHAFEVELLEEHQDHGEDRREIVCGKSDELTSPAIVKVALNSCVAGAPNTKDPQSVAEDSAAAVTVPEPNVEASACDLASEISKSEANPEDISDAIVVVVPQHQQPLNEHVEDSLKIRQSVDRSSCDLVTRIASYYSNQSDNEEEEDEEKRNKKPPVPLKTYQWEDIRRAKQQVGDILFASFFGKVDRMILD